MGWINHANAFGTAGLETTMMRDLDFIISLRDWILFFFLLLFTVLLLPM